ncbi:MAG: type II toxin-antitoxin system Phd/YefM family antitoxin [Terriglobales bacterium]
MEVSVAEAKAKLSEVIKEAERGGEVIITRRGKPVAKVTGTERKLKPIDLTEADAIRARQRMHEPSAKWFRKFRESERY